MALAAAPVKAPAPSWNPLRCGGTVLPVPLLLMAKLVAIALLLTNHVRLLPEPFLPFIPGLDRLCPPAVFQRGLQTVFLLSAAALLFNRKVRASCLLLGGSLLLGVISSKAYYGNNKTFAALLLVLTGLYEPARGAWLLRAQLVIVYFGAGLNKLLDPDWRSGLFFDHWAAVRLRHGFYIAAASAMPPLLLGKLICWTTIVAELGVSAAFLVRRAWPLAVWTSLLFHSSLLWFTGSTFTLFFYSMQAAMLVFSPWPAGVITVIYDGDCGFCARTRRLFERFDFEGAFVWRTWQSGAGGAHGISEAALRERLHLAAGGKVYAGFRAFQVLLLYNPVFYLAAMTVLALPGDGSLFRRLLVALLLAFFFPLFRPVGEAVYRVVARNRSRLSANAACRVE